MTEAGNSSRQAQIALALSLRANGQTWVEIADTLRARHGLNARAAMRIARGWSQSDVAEAWVRRWPDEPRTFKNISYWEQWPGRSGYAPSLDVLAKLAELYECRVADLVVDLADFRLSDRPPVAAADSEYLWPETSEGGAPQSVATLPPHEWYVETLRAQVRLDTETPEALEERRIVSTVHGLSHLSTALTVPRSDSQGTPHTSLNSEVVFGGRLVAKLEPTEHHHRYFIDIGRSLGSGERHEYALRHRIPRGQSMAPHYVCLPLLRCDFFELRVRFNLDRLPRTVWQIGGIPPRSIDNVQPSANIISPDALGEIRIRFRDLSVGFSYGAKWEFAT